MTTKQLKLALCVLGTGLMTMPVMANGSKGMDTNIAVEADGITVKGNISDVSGPLIGVPWWATSARLCRRCWTSTPRIESSLSPRG